MSPLERLPDEFSSKDESSDSESLSELESPWLELSESKCLLLRALDSEAARLRLTGWF